MAPPTVPEMTLPEFFEQKYLTDNIVTDNTERRIRGNLKRWKALTGDPPIRDITRDTVLAWRGELLKLELARSTVNSHCGVIRLLLRDAEHEISWRKVILKETHEIGHIPTSDDLDAVYRAAESASWPLASMPRFSRRESWCRCSAGEWWRCLLVCAVTTGLRRADLFALRWDDIDFKTGAVRKVAAKTGKTQRFPLLQCLDEHLQPLRQNATETVFSCSDRLKVIDHQLRRLCEAAGVTPFGLQCLRRFAGNAYELAAPQAGGLLLGHAVAHNVSFLSYIDTSEVLRSASAKLKLPQSFFAVN